MKYDTKEFEQKIKKTLSNLEETLSTIRASLANTSVISKVYFEYYGAETRIMDMASVSVTDARTITITPYDQKTLAAMKKALLASDVGITPVDDGRNIRLVFPQLSEERRHDLAKQIQKLGEEAKVAIRNLRRTANDEIKKLARIDDSGNREVFTDTDESKLDIKPYGADSFKLIKSRLPLKNSLKIALSSLKTKPLKLVMTIFLSARSLNP